MSDLRISENQIEAFARKEYDDSFSMRRAGDRTVCIVSH